MLDDVRYGLGMLRQTPLFTAAAVLTVALAIAANTTMLSVMNAVLLKPLPFHEPNRIVQVAEKNDKLNLSSFSSWRWGERCRAWSSTCPCVIRQRSLAWLRHLRA